MIKYQLWQEFGLDEEGNTVHPKMLYEGPVELALIYRASSLELDPDKHYMVRIDGDGKRTDTYSNDGPFKRLSQFMEWKGIRSGEIYTNGFIIQEQDDRSVGIFGGRYMLSGEFCFQDKEELDGFRAKLIEAFEWVSDPPPSVTTIEENQLLIMMEDEQYPSAKPEGLD